MIITLVKADFSANNIGTLDSFAVLTNILNATYSGPTSVTSGEAFTATITMYDGYTPGNIVVTMGGTKLTDVISIDGSIVTLTIGAVTGVIVINMDGKTEVKTYNDVKYWVRQSISTSGNIESPESSGYIRSNIMAVDKFTNAIVFTPTERMYCALVRYDADGNFLSRSAWDTPEAGVSVTYSDENPFNLVIATINESQHDLATMVSLIDVRDA